MNPYALPSFLAALPFAILGLGALLMNPRDRTTQLLSTMCLAFTLSGAAVGFLHLADSLSEATFWNPWPYGTILPGVLVIMEYCLSSSGRPERLRERWLGLSVSTVRLVAIAILAGAWVLSLATDLIITTPEHNATTGWEHGYGPAFPAFVVALGYVLLFNVVILWRGFAAATNPALRRFRLLNLLALGGGMAVACTLGYVLPGLMGLLTHSFAFLPLLVTIFLLTYGLMRLQAETIGDLTRGLEAKVASRTAELMQANAKLARGTELIRRYVPAQLAETLLAGEFQGDGSLQRRKLTLFFSDIKNFAGTADLMEPEDLSAVLNEYLSEMSNIAQRHGGTIDKFLGDAVVIFFGAPLATNDRDHAIRAVRMALEMQARMVTLGEKWRREGVEHPFEIRIGINTGHASVGNFGSADRLDYTAVGRQVNLAARLQAHCVVGRILLSHSTWVLVENEIECVDKGELAVKGFRNPVKVYEVVGNRVSGAVAQS